MASASEAEIAQRCVIVRAAAERPVVFALALLDRNIVDAGDTQARQPVLVKFPVLISVAAEPVAAVVVPLVREAHGNAVLAESPDFLDQAVVELAVPLAGQERFDRRTAVQEFGAVAPVAVARIGERDALRIARVPRILGEAHFLNRGFEREGWKGWAVLGHGSLRSTRFDRDFGPQTFGFELSGRIRNHAYP